MKNILILSFALISIGGIAQQVGTSITVNAGPDKCASPSATLTASATVTGFPATTQYTPSTPGSIPYYTEGYDGTDAYTGLTKLDDVWLDKIFNIGFPFSFYGNTYTQLVIGVNGEVTFDLTRRNTQEGYSFVSTLPGAVNRTVSIPNNTICALNRDINPALGGTIYTKMIGTAPCRSFVVSWVNIPLFSYSSECSGYGGQTFQLVLREGTNKIDVNILKSDKCTRWEGGGVIGLQAIQNGASSVFTAIASRNIVTPYANTWSAASESWRFTPSGAAPQVPYTGTITWTNQSGAVVGTGASLTVSPTTGTQYWANATYTNCSGTYTVNDAVYVNGVSNPGFSYTLTPATNYFTLSVTPTDVSQPNNWDFNYCHRIEGWNSTYTTALFKLDFCKNSANWNSYPNAEVFKGFDHTANNYTWPTITYPTVLPSTPIKGKFKNQYYYRIVRAAANNMCGWRETYANVAYFPAGALYEGNILKEPKLIMSEWKDVAELENTGGYNTGAVAAAAQPLNEFTDFFYIYPNPSKDVFFVDLNSEKEAMLQVVDMSGRVIKSIQLSGNDHYSLDLSGFSKGVYMLKVNGEEQQLKKVILE